jgi:uncharacterized membrane protein (DUF485 family)
MAEDDPRLEPQLSVRTLVAAKLRLLVPLTIIFMTCYIGLTVLAGFAKDVMAVKIIGSFNLGFALIAFNYVMSWALALIYERIADHALDPLASRVAVAASTETAGR